MNPKPQTCLIIGSPLFSLVNFRGPLIQTLINRGIKVYAASSGNDTRIINQLQGMGVEFFPIRLNRAGINPFHDLIAFGDIIQLLHRLKPTMVLSYTIKPNIFIALASRICPGTRIFTLIEGLGFVFMPAESMTAKCCSWIAKNLYKIALPLNHKVFFLNPDDLNQFVNEQFVVKNKTFLLNGIGIDLAHYAQEVIPPTKHLRFLMVSRLLKSKGVYTFIEAARALKKQNPDVEFILAGDTDAHPDSINKAELKAWQSEGLIQHTGWLNDVRPAIRDAHVFVLPSYYREGVPRTLLEAMSMGRALITTNTPGCCETIKSQANSTIGHNGIIIPPQDPQALAHAMQWFIDHPQEIIRMGDESRRYAQARFDVHKINALLLQELELT